VSHSAPIVLVVSDAEAGVRLDVVLQRLLPQFTRSRIQQWIKAGQVTIDGQAGKASMELKVQQRVEVRPAAAPPLNAFPEDIPLDILFEDEHLVAVNKAAGMVVHLGAGQHDGTLVNALLHRYGALAGGEAEERPGIVHRIDKDTSGVLLVARTDAAHQALAAQFTGRRIDKVYLALVQGVVPTGRGRIDKAIERDPRHRTRMTARTGQGRKAITEYCVVERRRGFTLLEVNILTGRTHQIRAHLAAIGYPVAGDRLYGAAVDAHTETGRFFLHAHRITFDHPATGERMSIEAPLAPELARWLASVELATAGE
jgi:23S rRNA pseudouridine1911/1915/1917 synthase